MLIWSNYPNRQSDLSDVEICNVDLQTLVPRLQDVDMMT